ncbi:MAG: phosphate acyltransferase PlsX [Erysipelotrichaceae bacterium]
MFKIGIDAMGGDKGPMEVITACKSYVKNNEAELVVYGSEEAIACIANTKNITGVVTTQVMEMEDGALAIRRKKDASMVKGIEALNKGEIDGFVSCGSTGALLSGATLILKTLPTVERPAILGVMPTLNEQGVIFLDMGANAVNSPAHLLSFAKIGSIYAKNVLGIENPSVAQLNIGGEELKGDPLRKETYQLLKAEETINFVGNIESNKMLLGEVNVIVTDGFSGNLVLKAFEGSGKLFTKTLKKTFMSNIITMFGALLSKSAINKCKDLLDDKNYGGALLAGVSKPVVKAHGNSDRIAFYNAIKQMNTMLEKDVVGKMQE